MGRTLPRWIRVIRTSSHPFHFNNNYYNSIYRVLSPAALWPEWLTSVPLLLYVAIACEVKPHLDRRDLMIIFLMFCTIFFGFLLVFVSNIYFRILCLCLSCICTASVIFFSILAKELFKNRINEPLWATHANMDVEIDFSDSIKLDIRSKSRLLEIQRKTIESALTKKNLSIICLYGMPHFPVIYFLSLSCLINEDVAYASTMVVGMLVKLFVATVVTEGNFPVTEDVDYMIVMNDIDVEADAIKKALSDTKRIFFFLTVKFS